MKIHFILHEAFEAPGAYLAFGQHFLDTIFPQQKYINMKSCLKMQIHLIF